MTSPVSHFNVAPSPIPRHLLSSLGLSAQPSLVGVGSVKAGASSTAAEPAAIATARRGSSPVTSTTPSAAVAAASSSPSAALSSMESPTEARVARDNDGFMRPTTSSRRTSTAVSSSGTPSSSTSLGSTAEFESLLSQSPVLVHATNLSSSAKARTPVDGATSRSADQGTPQGLVPSELQPLSELFSPAPSKMAGASIGGIAGVHNIQTELSGADAGVSLVKWYLRFTPKKKIYPFNIGVEGIVSDAASNPSNVDGILYHSSTITERVSASDLKSASGNLYRLRGPIDAERTIANGFSETVARAFVNGFPLNWKVLLKQMADEAMLGDKKPAAAQRSVGSVIDKKRPVKGAAEAKSAAQAAKSVEEKSIAEHVGARKRGRSNDEDEALEEASAAKKQRTKKNPIASEPSASPKSKPSKRKEPAESSSPDEDAKQKAKLQRRTDRLSKEIADLDTRTVVEPGHSARDAIPGLQTTRSGRRTLPPLEYWRGQKEVRDNEGNTIGILAGSYYDSPAGADWSEQKKNLELDTIKKSGVLRGGVVENAPVRVISLGTRANPKKATKKPAVEQPKVAGKAAKSDSSAATSGKRQKQTTLNFGTPPKPPAKKDPNPEKLEPLVESDTESLPQEPFDVDSFGGKSEGDAQSPRRSSRRAAQDARDMMAAVAIANATTTSGSEVVSSDTNLATQSNMLAPLYQAPRSSRDRQIWTDDELERLAEAVNSLKPSTPTYWTQVARRVGGRRGEECAQQFRQLMASPPPLSGKARSFKAAPSPKSSEIAAWVASAFGDRTNQTEGELTQQKFLTRVKDKRKLRQLIKDVERLHHDDPLATPRAGGHADDERSPSAAAWDTFLGNSSDSGSEASSDDGREDARERRQLRRVEQVLANSSATPGKSPAGGGLLRKVNRDDLDGYISQFQKRSQRGEAARKRAAVTAASVIETTAVEPELRLEEAGVTALPRERRSTVVHSEDIAQLRELREKAEAASLRAQLSNDDDDDEYDSDDFVL